jgi:hypothetical protein
MTDKMALREPRGVSPSPRGRREMRHQTRSLPAARGERRDIETDAKQRWIRMLT